MASAAVAKRRGSAYTARLAAKARRQKIVVAVLGVVLAALLAYEVPHSLKLLKGSSSAASAPTGSVAAPAAKHEAAKLPTGGCEAATGSCTAGRTRRPTRSPAARAMSTRPVIERHTSASSSSTGDEGEEMAARRGRHDAGRAADRDARHVRRHRRARCRLQL